MVEYSDLEFSAKSTDCGVNDNLFVSVLLGDLQETAEKGAEETGYGTRFVNENNCCWIILRTKLHINRLPRWKERFIIRTWFTGLEKLSFNREYEIYDLKGNVLGYATSVWILCDIDTHRPVIPGRNPNFPPPVPQSDRLVYGYTSPKIRFPDISEIEEKPVISKYADFSELDRNHHVNNSRYLAWVYDCLYKSGFDTNIVKDISVNYISEVKAGEKIDIYMTENSGIISIYGFKNGKDKVFAVDIET